MAFSPDGKSLMLPKGKILGGRVERWSLETGKMRALTSSANKKGASATSVALSGDGRLLAAYNTDVGITVWELPGNRELSRIPLEPPRYVDEMAFCDGSATIVAVLGYDSEKKPFGERWKESVARWEAPSGRQVGSLVFDPDLDCKALSPDGRFAVLQNEIRQGVYNTKDAKEVFRVEKADGFVFAADGSTLVSYQRGGLSVLEVPSGRLKRHVAFDRTYPESEGSIALSSDVRVLAVGGFRYQNVVGLISTESGKILSTFECGPSGMICDTVCFSPDGRMLVTDTYEWNDLDQRVQPLLKFWRLPTSW